MHAKLGGMRLEAPTVPAESPSASPRRCYGESLLEMTSILQLCLSYKQTSFSRKELEADIYQSH